MAYDSFVTGEIVHYWAPNGGRPIVPVEVEIAAVSEKEYKVRLPEGTLLRFRKRDRRPVGSVFGGPDLKPIDRAARERQEQALALHQMRVRIFGRGVTLSSVHHWSNDPKVLQLLAEELAMFIKRAEAIGADVDPILREWRHEFLMRQGGERE